MRILVFGDSITQGHWDSQGGWAERLRLHFWHKFLRDEDKDPPSVFNLGISSNSARDVLERLETESAARDNGEGLIIVISIGINDSRLNGNEPFSNLAEYRRTMVQLLERAQKITDKVLLVGCTSCDESLVNPVAWGTTCYKNDRIWEFEMVLRDLCKQQNLMHVPLFEAFQQRQGMLSDGLHPNDIGHERIYQLVLPELEKLL